MGDFDRRQTNAANSMNNRPMQVVLQSYQRDFLLDVVQRRKPFLAERWSHRGALVFTRQEVRELIDGLAVEFVDTGLESNDEPNMRGYQIEELIDILNRVLIND